MKLKFYLSLGVVLFLTVVSAWWMRNKMPSDPLVHKPVFLAMASDRDAGAFIQAGDLVWRAWSGPVTESTSSSYFVKGEVKPESLVGSVLRVPVKQGQFIESASTVRTGDAAFLSAVLKPGSRAIAIPIDRVSGSSGLIQPGNYVDVIVSKSSSSGFEKTQDPARTMLSNVRVIAINQKTETLASMPPATTKADVPGLSENNLDRGTATLEVSPRQAELLASARHAGALSLSLRSLIPNADKDTDLRDLELPTQISSTSTPLARPEPDPVIQLLGTERRVDSSGFKKSSL